MRILLTGAAGFIGFHVAKRLLERGDEVIGIDNFNAYYDVSIKQNRAEILQEHELFSLEAVDIANRPEMERIFSAPEYDAVVNLPAQAGVRYSLENPYAHVDAKVVGVTNILAGVRHHGTGHFVYASTSSVYGLNPNLPYKESADTDH